MTVTIYHNPRCSKSRQALALLEARGLDVEIVRYLEEAPSRGALKRVIEKLGIGGARDMMRPKEARYKDLGLRDVTAESALIGAMAENPILIERPIVINGERAVIARPPEKALEIL